MSKSQLKKHLTALTKEQVIDVVLELYEARKEAKEYLLSYLQAWIDHLSRFTFSYRKGIVRAIYNKIDSMDVE